MKRVDVESRECTSEDVEISVHTHDGSIMKLVAGQCPFRGSVVIETTTYTTMPSITFWVCPVCDTTHEEEEE